MPEDAVERVFGALVYLVEGQACGGIDVPAQERVGDLLSFMESVDSWYGEVRRLPRAARVKLVTYGAKLSQWLR